MTFFGEAKIKYLHKQQQQKISLEYFIGGEIMLVNHLHTL